VVECGATSQAGYDAVAAVLETSPTAILSYNDLVALGALSRLHELDIAVPADISVIGFDDLSLERVAHTNLTTVSVSRDELGRRAGEILEQLLVHGYDAAPVYLPMQLHVRDTTAAPR